MALVHTEAHCSYKMSCAGLQFECVLHTCAPLQFYRIIIIIIQYMAIFRSILFSETDAFVFPLQEQTAHYHQARYHLTSCFVVESVLELRELVNPKWNKLAIFTKRAQNCLGVVK